MFKNARDVIRESMGPYLEPGEMIQKVFGAQTGPSPWNAWVNLQARWGVFGVNVEGW